MGSPKLPALLKKFATKGHAEHLPFQLSPTRGPFNLIDDAFRRQQAVADKALFPKSLGKRSRLSDSERKIEIERQRDRQAKLKK
ncbi:hypothetical protein VNO77_46206 [Canavalia gladiata]|uniref:Uncharacterized protein n=1 Tax=Canavalia gladiata TaxID=3824 RepID=A0AAN9JGU7_CANGL